MGVVCNIFGGIFSLGIHWVMACMYDDALWMVTIVYGNEDMSPFSEKSKRRIVWKIELGCSLRIRYAVPDTRVIEGY